MFLIRRFHADGLPPGFISRTPPYCFSLGSLAIRLIFAQQLGDRSPARLILEIDKHQFLPAAVLNDKAGVQFLDGPGKREVARAHVARWSGRPARLCSEPVADDASTFLAMFSRYCLGAVTAPAGAGPRGSSRSSMHFLRKASRPSACSRCWSAPNLQVAIFCFASTAKHGPAGKSTIRAAARNAQRDILPPCL